MKYELARLELKKVLKNQKTITTEKLKVLLMSMNISFKKTQEEVTDSRIARYERLLAEKNVLLDKYRMQIANQKKTMKRLEEAQKQQEK